MSINTPKITQDDKHSSWLNNPVHGHIFQLKILMLFLHRGIACKYSFRLGTEIRQARKFDDLVFEYTQDGTKIYRLLQAKHKVDETRKITVEKLLCESKGDFSLMKYFQSYYNCKRDEYFKDGYIKDVTVCTNINFDFDDLKKFNIQVEKINDKDDILDVESKTKQPIRYKFNNNIILPVLRKKLKSNKFSSVREVLDDDIEDFLQHLVFAVNQPNEEELGYIIKKEIGKELDFITTENVYYKFYGKMLDWMKDKGKFMSYNEGKNLFDEVEKGSFIWYNIQDPVLSFTGRQEQLEKMHELLQKNKTICICGLGGVGKSELVKKYAAKYSQNYENKILWINAESYQTLVDSFQKLACDKLDISTINADGKDKQINLLVEEVYKYFHTSKSLFIFDNAEFYGSKNDFDSGIDRFLPYLPNNCSKPNIIITSRNQKWPENIKMLALDGFTEDEASTFVENYLHLSTNEEKEHVQNLVKVLQLLPLALQQAVAYIRTRNWELKELGKKFQIKDYIESFSEKSKEFLSYELPSDCDIKYSKTVLSTWNVTFDILKSKENGHYALELLDIIAYLLPDNISTELLSSIFENQEQLVTAISLLNQYSLVNFRYRALSIHRLVQQVTRMKIVENRKEEEVLTKILMKIISSTESIVNSKNVDHFLSVWTHAKRHAYIFLKYNDALTIITHVLMHTGRNEEAYSMGTENTMMLNQLSSNNTEAQYLISSSRINSAEALHAHGKYREALEEYEQIYESIKDTECIGKILDVKSLMADTLRALGRDRDAFKLYREALTEYRIDLGEDDPKTLTARSNIASFLANEGKFNEALMIKKEIHRKLEASCGKDSECVLDAKVHIADLLDQFGKFDEAIILYKEVYNHRVSILGNKHVKTLETKIRIANTLHKFGKLEEAMILFQEIYNIQIDTLIENHPNILLTKSEMAYILAQQGNLNKSLEIYREVYRITSEKFDERHLQIIFLLSSIATILYAQNNLEEALEISYKVLRRKRQQFGFYHIQVAETLRHIVFILIRQNEDDRALKALKEYLQCEISLFGKDSIKTFDARYGIILISRKQHKYDEALKQFSELHQILKMCLGVEDPITLKARHSIGRMYVYKEHYDEALNIFTEVCEIQESTLGKNHPACVEARKEISEIRREQQIYKNIMKVAKKSKQKVEYLIAAIRTSNLNRLERLLKEGVDIDSEDENKYTLLHHAINLNQLKSVQYLLENGADVNRCIGRGNTPLHMAASKGSLKIVKELLSHVHQDKLKDFIDAKTSNIGRAALHVAAKKGFGEIVTHLLSQGATYDLKNNAGQSSLDVASNQKVKEDLKNVDKMFEYARSGSKNLYSQLMRCSAVEYVMMINARNGQCYNLLQVAVSNNHEKLVDLLLELRSDQFYSIYTDTSNLEHITVDMDALSGTNYTMDQARDLVKTFKGTKESAFNPNICTIEDMLKLLEPYQNTKFAKLAKRIIDFHIRLLKKSVDIRNNTIELLEAAKRNDFIAVKHFILKGADLSEKANRRWTALHYSANISKEKMVKELLDRGAKAYSTMNLGITVLHIAANKK